VIQGRGRREEDLFAMIELLEILAIVLPVFLVIGVGFVLGRTGFVDERNRSSLSRLVFYLAAPALLFRSTARTPVHDTFKPEILLVTGGASLLLAALVYWTTRRFEPARRGVLAQGAHRSNMVFFGLPIVLFTFGESALGPAAVLIGFMVVVYNLLAVVVLVLPHRSDNQGGGVRAATALEIVRNPLILACGAGLLVSAAAIPIPTPLDRALELLGRIAAPLALLTVGAGIDFRRLKGDFGPAVAVSACKLILYPALIYAGLLLVGAGETERQVTVLILASPTAVVSFIMAREMKGDEQLARAIVIGTTLFSLFTTSAWLALFRIMG